MSCCAGVSPSRTLLCHILQSPFNAGKAPKAEQLLTRFSPHAPSAVSGSTETQTLCSDTSALIFKLNIALDPIIHLLGTLQVWNTVTVWLSDSSLFGPSEGADGRYQVGTDT